MEQIAKSGKHVEAALPAEMASAVNLMVHPIAGLAAVSAIGLGMVGHAFGMWAGAMAGAAEASRRMLELAPDALEPASAARKELPAERARAATATLIADAKRNAADPAPKAVRETRPVGAAKPVADTRSASAVQPKPTNVVVLPVAAPVVERARAPVPEPVDAAASRPKAMDRPATPDNLKAISGIGPKLEQVLNGLGIWTYGQIAAWTAQEIAWVDDHLSFTGRIGRDDWIGQATKLAQRK